MRLCAVIQVDKMSRLRNVTPDTYVLGGGRLLGARLHADDVGHPADEMVPGDIIRVCVPVTIVQAQLDLEGSEATGEVPAPSAGQG